MKRTSLLGCAVALAAATAAPAGASAPSLGGFVTASDGGTSGGCAYTRTSPVDWGHYITLDGAATSLPEGLVTLTCTVSTWGGDITVRESARFATTVSGNGVLTSGPTTICVELDAQHTIDVRDYAYACETF